MFALSRAYLKGIGPKGAFATLLRRLRSRDLIILIGLWLVAASLICGLAVWFLVSRPVEQAHFGEAAAKPSPVPTYTVQFVKVTARQLYPTAEALARSWEPDAQLVGVNASWLDTAVNLVGDTTDWSFRFYSPSRQRLYLVGIGGDGQAVGAPHFQKEITPPSTVNLEAWAIDSPEALARWLDNGGGELLGRSPGADVTIQLGVGPVDGQLTWVVTGFDAATSQSLALKVDAANGQVSVLGPQITEPSTKN